MHNVIKQEILLKSGVQVNFLSLSTEKKIFRPTLVASWKMLRLCHGSLMLWAVEEILFVINCQTIFSIEK